MALLFLNTNTTYNGDNDTLDAKSCDMSNHRLVQVSLCRYNTFHDGYTFSLESNFSRIIDTSIAESAVAKMTVSLAASPPADKKDVPAIALVASDTVLCMDKKVSYILKQDGKIDNYDIHKLDQKLLDNVGGTPAEVLPIVIAELKAAGVVIGFNVAYHMAALRYEAGLLSLEFPEVPMLCLSTICRELSASPLPRSEISYVYGDYACSDFSEATSNCYVAANIFFKMVSRRQINFV